MTQPERTGGIIAYIRVSTQEQAADGYGLDAQLAHIHEACERRDWTLEHVYRDEGASGKTLDRPALLDALTVIGDREAQGLIVAKLDRLTRSVIDFGLLLEWFDQAGAALVALDFDLDTSTPAGRLIGHIMASVAEWERATVAQRTRDGMAVARASGKRTGRPSVSERPELVAWIRAMRGEGLSLAAICERLNDDGVPTARGAPLWRQSAVQSVLGYQRRVAARRVVSLPEVRR